MNTLKSLLGCTIPIQLAAMPGVVTPELAIAVSAAGALGMISAMRMSPDGLASLLDSIRARTSRAAGVNFLMPFLDREVLAVAAAKTKLVEFFYGDPDPALIGFVHEKGALVSWQVGSVDEAVAAERAGADLIIAQGSEAGGHVRGTSSLLPLLASVLTSVRVPVLASGGIATASDVSAVLNAGAAGARVGTRFIAATESGAHPQYVDAVLRSRAEDTVITETFSATWPHAPHRVLRSCVDAVHAFSGSVVAELDAGGKTIQIPRFGSPAPTKNTTGHIEAMALYAGESVSKVTKVQPAAEILTELVSEISL